MEKERMGPRRDEEDRGRRLTEGVPKRFCGTACGSLLRNGLWIRVWRTGRDRPGLGGSDRRGGTLPSRRNGAMTSGRRLLEVAAPSHRNGSTLLRGCGVGVRSRRRGQAGRDRGRGRKGWGRAQGVDQGGDPGRQSQSSGLLESLLGARSSGRPGGRPPSVRNEGR